MLATVIDIDSEKASLLILVIEPDNLKRMLAADPITLLAKNKGGLLPAIKYPDNLQMVLAYEEDIFEIHRLCKTGATISALIKYLNRGFTWKEDMDGMKNLIKL